MRRVLTTIRPALATFAVILISNYLLVLGVAFKGTGFRSIRRGLTTGPTPLSDLTSPNFSFPFWKMRMMRPGWAGLGAHVLESDSPTLPLPSCSLLSKFLNLAVPQFPYLSQQGLGEDLSLGAAAEIKLVNICQGLKEYSAKDK